MTEELYKTIQPNDLFRIIDDDGRRLIIDLRSARDFRIEHINGSINIPRNILEQQIDELTRDADVILVCNDGKLARHTAIHLNGHGHSVKVLEGGIMLWRCSRLPTVHSIMHLPVEKQVDIVFGAGALATVAMLWSAWPHSLILGTPVMLGLFSIKFAKVTLSKRRQRIRR